MDPVKAAFLQAIMNQGKDIHPNNFLPFFLAMQKNAKERNLSFSKDEADSIYSQMKSSLSASDQKQLEFLKTILLQDEE